MIRPCAFHMLVQYEMPYSPLCTHNHQIRWYSICRYKLKRWVMWSTQHAWVWNLGPTSLFELNVGMAIFANSMHTRSNSTRMRPVLPDLFNLGTDMDFTYKTRDGFGSGTDNDMPCPKPNPLIWYKFYSLQIPNSQSLPTVECFKRDASSSRWIKATPHPPFLRLLHSFNRIPVPPPAPHLRCFVPPTASPFLHWLCISVPPRLLPILGHHRSMPCLSAAWMLSVHTTKNHLKDASISMLRVGPLPRKSVQA